MIDVFVRWWPDSEVRTSLGDAVVWRLLFDESQFQLHLIACREAKRIAAVFLPTTHHVIEYIDADDFHLASKRRAAELATTDYLLIVDDDQLPLYRDWVGYAVSLTKRFPEYAAIAGWSVTHEVPRPAALIEESDSIGCPMIVRRSALLDATAEPIDNPQRADTILTERLQRHGKTGIARNWRYNHLGMGYSQVIPQHWMPECPV